ncbi:galactose/methyl galactoside ABC transporter permease MglC [Fusobacterium sp. MFO224]|uniref:galactose/methyl galactoside ABC transporter permease MglC n=1 Tax=Fusobacterium sp. MFO224 TaxID=3378070 RepID=UPI0038535F4C
MDLRLQKKKNGKIDIKNLLIRSGLYLVLFLMLVMIVVKEPTFLSIRNFKNILTQSSVRAIIALGVGGIIVTQGTDLSAGRQVGLAAVISASLLQATDNINKVYPDMGQMPLIVVILIVMAIGAVIGAFNGVITVCLNIHPFIVTMGSMTIVYGINSLYYDFAGASPISGFSESYSHFAQGSFNIFGFRLPYLIIYATIAMVIMWVLWNKTKFGKNVFAAGGNPEAARVSGVNVILTMVLIYALSGMYYAFGGFLEAGRIGSATNNLGFMYEMDAIAACVIGGVSFYGGVGRISGVMIGVIILTVLNYGLTYVGVSPYWQYIIKGAIIIAAVAFDAMKYAKKH